MASGNTLAVFTPAANEPPSSDFATLDTRNSILVLDFDASTDEAAIFRGVLPSNYAGGGVTIDVFWTTTATTGDCIWNAAWEENDANNNDIDTDAFGTASTVTTAADATSGQIVKSTLTISSANMGSAVAGDPFRLKISRDADNASDTMAADAELLSVHVKES